MRAILIALLMTLATQVVGWEERPITWYLDALRDGFYAFREETNCKQSSPFIQGLVEQCFIASEPIDLEILNGLVALLSEIDHKNESCTKSEIELCEVYSELFLLLLEARVIID